MKKSIFNLMIGVPLIAIGLNIIFGEKLQMLPDDFVINLDLFGEFDVVYIFPIVELVLLVILYVYNRKLKLIRKKEFLASFISILLLLICLYVVNSYILIEPVSSKILGLIYGGFTLLVGFGFMYKSNKFLLPHDIYVSCISVHSNRKYIYVKVIFEFIITLILFIFVKHSVIDVLFLMYLLVIYFFNAIIADFTIDLSELESREKRRILDRLKESKN